MRERTLHFGEKIGELVFVASTGVRVDSENVFGRIEFHFGTGFEMELIGDRLRDADRETVAPFLNDVSGRSLGLHEVNIRLF